MRMLLVGHLDVEMRDHATKLTAVLMAAADHCLARIGQWTVIVTLGLAHSVGHLP